MKKYIQCPSCTAILEVSEDGSVKELEWWELLDWKNIPQPMFDKLPIDIRFKIDVRQGTVKNKEA